MRMDSKMRIAVFVKYYNYAMHLEWKNVGTHNDNICTRIEVV
jgi:hypothetical protein